MSSLLPDARDKNGPLSKVRCDPARRFIFWRELTRGAFDLTRREQRSRAPFGRPLLRYEHVQRSADDDDQPDGLDGGHCRRPCCDVLPLALLESLYIDRTPSTLGMFSLGFFPFFVFDAICSCRHLSLHSFSIHLSSSPAAAAFHLFVWPSRRFFLLAST